MAGFNSTSLQMWAQQELPPQCKAISAIPEKGAVSGRVGGAYTECAEGFEIKRNLIEIKRSLIEINRDLIEINRDLIEINRDLIKDYYLIFSYLILSYVILSYIISYLISFPPRGGFAQ